MDRERNDTGLSACVNGGRFAGVLADHGLAPLTRAPLAELQVNVGRLCNQACSHCHVEAGPNRTEIMSWETMARIASWAGRHGIAGVDITGGAPELNPNFRHFVDALLAQGASITARCNLTVLLEAGQDDLAQWYAQRNVRLVCSLPCYSRDNVEQQRGRGVFDKSIEALQRLNRCGYGVRPELTLDLVYNPNGAFLPPPQKALEAQYRAQLGERFGIRFTRLLALTNLPINRFAHFLERSGQAASYRALLRANFNAATVPDLMCRHLISVDWRGRVYDCDFNQMLDIPLAAGGERCLWEIDARSLIGARVAVGSHCFGCTAGAGSSCGGALT